MADVNGYRARKFEEEFWNISGTLSWIAFRDRYQFNPDNAMQCVVGTVMFPTLGGAIIDRYPERTLLNALQSGRMTAIRSGELLPDFAWADKSVGGNGNVFFRRTEALAIWPPAETSVAPDVDVAPDTSSGEAENGRARQHPSTGPRPGKPSPKNVLCELAIELLEGGIVPAGRGAVAAIARHLEGHGGLDSLQRQTVEKYIRDTVNEWKALHPDISGK